MTFKLKTPPDGCVNAEEHERRLVALADRLEERAQQLLDKDGRIDVATGNQLSLAAIRARNAAAELAVRREDIEHTEHLLAHEKRRLGLDGPMARPRRLQRK